jgi:hypothetical protein
MQSSRSIPVNGSWVVSTKPIPSRYGSRTGAAAAISKDAHVPGSWASRTCPVRGSHGALVSLPPRIWHCQAIHWGTVRSASGMASTRIMSGRRRGGGSRVDRVRSARGAAWDARGRWTSSSSPTWARRMPGTSRHPRRGRDSIPVPNRRKSGMSTGRPSSEHLHAAVAASPEFALVPSLLAVEGHRDVANRATRVARSHGLRRVQKGMSSSSAPGAGAGWATG